MPCMGFEVHYDLCTGTLSGIWGLLAVSVLVAMIQFESTPPSWTRWKLIPMGSEPCSWESFYFPTYWTTLETSGFHWAFLHFLLLLILAPLSSTHFITHFLGAWLLSNTEKIYLKPYGLSNTNLREWGEKKKCVFSELPLFMWSVYMLLRLCYPAVSLHFKND